MTEKMLEYREKHKKCRFCKYYSFKSIDVGTQSFETRECVLKEKLVHYPNLIRFCSYYEVKNNESKAK